MVSVQNWPRMPSLRLTVSFALTTICAEAGGGQNSASAATAAATSARMSGRVLTKISPTRHHNAKRRARRATVQSDRRGMADPFEKALDRSLAWARALRRRTAGWSAGDDRAFHDALFSAPAHDPFSVTYPGNVTIRRFADRADPYVQGAGTVVDLGCGPGEITCELARRHPATRFLGVDHSAMAIEQARRNAGRLDVANVTFEVADISSYALPGRTDLVTMFDAFH